MCVDGRFEDQCVGYQNGGAVRKQPGAFKACGRSGVGIDAKFEDVEVLAQQLSEFGDEMDRCEGGMNLDVEMEEGQIWFTSGL